MPAQVCELVPFDTVNVTDLPWIGALVSNSVSFAESVVESFQSCDSSPVYVSTVGSLLIVKDRGAVELVT